LMTDPPPSIQPSIICQQQITIYSLTHFHAEEDSS